ncbi:hypothetical protein ACFWXA_30800 [Streptomyces atroolivaceus]|uniref:hypothetical protein n=1 Tax=Streptomyces atroolivaceus TaxID=66869 RepID=UPI00364619AF
MTDMIEVQPAKERRVDFARWAVAQTPKIRTVGPALFAVPLDLFGDMPEPLLIGARVDGHRYVSPDEDQAQGGELLGVATAEGLTGTVLPELEGIPGEPLPEVPPEAYGPDSTPLPAPDPADPPAAQTDGVYPCSGCDKEFTTERGRDTHSRMKHPEG